MTVLRIIVNATIVWQFVPLLGTATATQASASTRVAHATVVRCMTTSPDPPT